MRRFLICGRTGVGKSSYINAAFGIPLARTSAFEACTTTVEYYTNHTLWGDICIIDTPGLAEEDDVCDDKHMTLIKNKVKMDSIFALLYVSKLNETRFYPDEKRTLRVLTKHLGASVWDNAWLILTFAASVPCEHRNQAVWKKAENIEEHLRSLTNYRFNNQGVFKKIFMVDNVVFNWCTDGIPIASSLAS